MIRSIAVCELLYKTKAFVFVLSPLQLLIFLMTMDKWAV